MDQKNWNIWTFITQHFLTVKGTKGGFRVNDSLRTKNKGSRDWGHSIPIKCTEESGCFTEGNTVNRSWGSHRCVLTSSISYILCTSFFTKFEEGSELLLGSVLTLGGISCHTLIDSVTPVEGVLGLGRWFIQFVPEPFPKDRFVTWVTGFGFFVTLLPVLFRGRRVHRDGAISVTYRGRGGFLFFGGGRSLGPGPYLSDPFAVSSFASILRFRCQASKFASFG